MTLDIVAVRGQVTWWTWVIRDAAGVAIEESKTQFRVIEDAKANGHARLAQLQGPRPRPAQD